LFSTPKPSDKHVSFHHPAAARHAYSRGTADLYISAIESPQPCSKYFMRGAEMVRKR